MNQKPEFDARRSDAIRALLVETVEQPGRARRPRNRTLVGMAAVVVAAVLASGSIALAVGGQTWFGSAEPSMTPTPTTTMTPSPTPSVTPAPTPTPAQGAMPASIIPVDCATLLPEGSLGGPMAGATLGGDSVKPFTPYYASVLQAGVLSCQWSDTVNPEGGLLTFYASTDAEAGADQVEQMIAGGAQPIGVGDAAAVSCSATSECKAVVIVGTYWLEYSLRVWQQNSEQEVIAVLEQAGSTFASALQQHPTPLPEWVPPASSWASVADCDAISPAVPMGELLSSPEVQGPFAVDPGTTPTVVQAASSGLVCRWSIPGESSVPRGALSGIDVQLAAGTGWVADDSTVAGLESTAVDVPGADMAALRCQFAEGEMCWLDVYVDNSWLQVGYGGGFVAADKQILVTVATSIVATRNEH